MALDLRPKALGELQFSIREKALEKDM